MRRCAAERRFETPGDSGTERNLTPSPGQPTIRAMRQNRRRTLAWAALAALALLVFAAVPHLHEEVDGHGEHCVLCYAQDAPFIASGLQAAPDPAVRAAVIPAVERQAHGMTPTGGGGSRAPPA